MIKWFKNDLLPCFTGVAMVAGLSFMIGSFIASGIAYGLRGTVMVSVINTSELKAAK